MTIDLKNPFKDISQTQEDNPDMFFALMKGSGVKLITLNKLISKTSDETLLSRNYEGEDEELGFVTENITETAADFNFLIAPEDFLVQDQATSFSDYYSRKMVSTKKLFKFLDKKFFY